MTRDPRIALIERAGVALGRTWQSRIAAASRISPALLSAIMSGERRLTDDAAARIAAGLREVLAVQLEAAALQMREIAEQIDGATAEMVDRAAPASS